jgi:hypothetical protein
MVWDDEKFLNPREFNRPLQPRAGGGRDGDVRWRRALALLWVAPALAAGWAWARSGREMDEFSAVDRDNVLRAAVSYQGALHFLRAENNAAPRRLTWDSYALPKGATWDDLLLPEDTDWRRLGFAKFSAPHPTPGGAAGVMVLPRLRRASPWLFTHPYRAISVPYWAIILLAAAPAGIVLFRVGRRATRTRRGCCAGCGYDLRATTERCPECGEPVLRDRRGRGAEAVATA